MKQLCPRCDFQGILFDATVVATGEKVVVCDECEALWLRGDDVSTARFTDMGSHLESQGLYGGWKELCIGESLSENFTQSLIWERTSKGFEIHICVSKQYELLWSAKLDELSISYAEACQLIGAEPVYLDELNGRYQMILEYVDSYWRDQREMETEFHIRIPFNYETLWLIKLAQLVATPEEIEKYVSEN